MGDEDVALMKITAKKRGPGRSNENALELFTGLVPANDDYDY